MSETPDATRRFAVVTGGADGIGRAAIWVDGGFLVDYGVGTR